MSCCASETKCSFKTNKSVVHSRWTSAPILDPIQNCESDSKNENAFIISLRKQLKCHYLLKIRVPKP